MADPAALSRPSAEGPGGAGPAGATEDGRDASELASVDVWALIADATPDADLIYRD